jgi:formate C-acetyltransferase
MVSNYFTSQELEDLAKKLYTNERNITRLDGWFLVKEIYERVMQQQKDMPHIMKTAHALRAVIEELPLYIDENNVFAGTQRDAFAKSYALINPNFRVNTFNGYCDPTQVFQDIEPNNEFSPERITKVRKATQNSDYVTALKKVYDSAHEDTAEVTYFIEQVTGHLIPDFRPALKHGIKYIQEIIKEKLKADVSEKKKLQYQAMEHTLGTVQILAKRYADLAKRDLNSADEKRRRQLTLLIHTLEKVPEQGADSLYEAIQSFILLWQVMCLEQAPNPFAFSVGNADRIFEPYREKENLSREYTAGLLKHFLVFFNVGDRSWAISQNIIVGGKDKDDKDMTNLTSYALLDAYYAMNLPQPILSVKVHRNTPDQLYEELGRFFFTPGCLTPSLFNDDSVFEVLKQQQVEAEDLPDYSIAGCQEPLIMGRDNGNTTNSWLNLAKILELTLNDGKSLVTGNKIGKSYEELGIPNNPKEVLENIREAFYKQLEYFVDRMTEHANGASVAVSYLPVPYLSCFMGGIESGIDTRDSNEQGTKYNGSGCLIHGLSVIADSIIAIDTLLSERPGDCERLLTALNNDFKGDEDLRQYLLKCDKFGNNKAAVDQEAVDLANRISNLVRSRKNYLGNSFRPDFATPSTHLIYGSLVGAMPNGRKAKDMLNYGVDPLYGDAQNGLGYRVLSTQKLPYEQFSGGYASHLGLDPNYFRTDTKESKGLEFKTKVLNPLFFGNKEGKIAPFYLYVNITTPDTLRKVLANPKKYVPSGVYIMRIHGTFVNFLDLSPEIQEDIIKRLDLQSTIC